MPATYPYSSSLIIRPQIRGFTLCRILEACTLYLQKEALPMMKPNSGVADTAIDRSVYRDLKPVVNQKRPENADPPRCRFEAK